MVMTLSLALRNLLRNRRRSLATLLALAIGAASILVFGGYSKNIRYSMLSAYVRTGGHLQIQHRDFFLFGGGNPTAYGIDGYERVLAAIRDDEVLRRIVLVASPKLQFGGIAGNYAAGVSRTVLGAGYEASDYSRMLRWSEHAMRLSSIAFPLEGSAPDSAIVGVGVARVLLLCDQLGVADCAQPRTQQSTGTSELPSDIASLAAAEAPADAAPAGGAARLELLASTGRGTPNVAALNVIAAANQGFKELDDVSVLLHLDQAQRLVYGRSAPRATSIMVQLQRTDQIEQATRRLQALLAEAAPGQPLAVLDFATLNPFYVQTQQLFDTIFGFIFALIGAIVLFTVGNTMTAAVVERTVEVGTIRAIGVRRGGVQRLFLTEGFLLGCAGALAGVLVALAIAFVVNRLGLTWVPPGAAEQPLSLIVWGEFPMMIAITLGLIVISLASAWWPAYRAARLNIVEALRHA